jgi:hypothetical protein
MNNRRTHRETLEE